MNIIEAYEKGSVIKRSLSGEHHTTETVLLGPRDVLATDWEIVTPRPPKLIKKSRTVWVNCYSSGTVEDHATKERADRLAASNRVVCKEFTYEWFEDKYGNVVKEEK